MAKQYEVTAHSLNVRAAPSLTGTVIGFLRRGDVVRLLEQSSDLYWYRVARPSGETGWVSHKFLAAIESHNLTRADDPPWLRIALEELGVKEFAGASDNPRIVEYHRTTTLGPVYATQDETPWCSSFVNWCFEEAYFEGTDSAAARSWIEWGTVLERPRRGCVTIFTRPPNPASGHVGFYMDADGESIYLLGGNQSNAVNISRYPKGRVLGFRWPGAV